MRSPGVEEDVLERVDEILDFWFSGAEGDGPGGWRSVWFARDEAFDREIGERLGTYYEQAASGELDGWMKSARGCLALILLLDQVPRNLFRNDPRSFATDVKALAVARHAVDRALDRELPPVQRSFMYMPFEHSESIEDQNRSVELFTLLDTGLGVPAALDYARRHRVIIERFGRFPHRNTVLGRLTTPEEAEFLNQPGSSF